MERTEVFEAIRSVAAEVLGIDPSGIAETARFKEDLEADSLHLVELVMGLEDHFGIDVPEGFFNAPQLAVNIEVPETVVSAVAG